jgi:hypothetical protein
MHANQQTIKAHWSICKQLTNLTLINELTDKLSNWKMKRKIWHIYPPTYPCLGSVHRQDKSKNRPPRLTVCGHLKWENTFSLAKLRQNAKAILKTYYLFICEDIQFFTNSFCWNVLCWVLHFYKFFNIIIRIFLLFMMYRQCTGKIIQIIICTFIHSSFFVLNFTSFVHKVLRLI